MFSATLPVLLALSWVPTAALPMAPSAPTVQKTDQAPQSVGTVTCPINGSEIPACCCPLKK